VLLLPAPAAHVSDANGLDARIIPACWEDDVVDVVPLASEPIASGSELPALDGTSAALQMVQPLPMIEATAAGAGDVLRPFLANVSSAIPLPLLPAPSAPSSTATVHARKKRAAASADGAVRRSSRIASKKKQEATKAEGVAAVQELIARACGAVAKEGSFDDAAKASYLRLFSTQLPAPVILAIEALIKQVKKSKKAKGKGKAKAKGKKTGSSVSLDIASV
jgi:hypothetical protein